MNINRRLAQKSLSKKGFRKDKSRDHVYYFHEYKGKESGIFTYVSHSTKFRDLTRDILSKIKKELRLNTNLEVYNFLTCPMDENEYNRILIERGILKL